MASKDFFDVNLIRDYPQNTRKLNVECFPYDIKPHNTKAENIGSTVLISPHGLEINVPQDYPVGTLLKIHLTIPDYWERKKQFVDYNRVDRPGILKILAKVVKVEDHNRRQKRKLLTLQTVNIDEVDEKVLISYLREDI